MVPGPNDPRWTRILQSESDLSAATLATKFLITRLRREVKGSPAEMSAKVAELCEYFRNTPFAQKDIALL
jgi:hypothetical protein